MTCLHLHPIRTAVSFFSVGLLGATSLAFAQQPDQPPQTWNPSGGWRRVGDPPRTSQSTAPAYPAISSDQQAADSTIQSGDPNQAPEPQPSYPQPTYQQAPYNGPNQPSYNQQPNYSARAPIPTLLTIPAGTFITVRVNEPLSSDKNHPGDAFSATLVLPIVVNGIVIAEPGQTLEGQVARVQKHGVGHAAELGIRLTTLSLVDGQQVTINSQLISRQGGTTPGGAEAGAVIATTGLGAAIGAAADWGTGAAIGAGAGAAAGLIGVLVTHNHASVIYPEQVLTFRLDAAQTISTASAPQAFRYFEPGEYDRASNSGPEPRQQYSATPPPAPAPYYGYPYPSPYPYYYAYGYPYYWWGPSFAFYWGPGYYYGHGYYAHGYYGHGYYGPYHGGSYAGHGYVAGGYARGGGGHH